MSLRQAAQQALEALECDPDAMVEVTECHWDYKRDLAIAALRTALAEPEQEVEQEVEQALEALNKMQSILMMKDGRHPRDVLRAFIQQAAPTPRKPLTGKQRESIMRHWWHVNFVTVGDIIDAIERAHGITGDSK